MPCASICSCRACTNELYCLIETAIVEPNKRWGSLFHFFSDSVPRFMLARGQGLECSYMLMHLTNMIAVFRTVSGFQKCQPEDCFLGGSLDCWGECAVGCHVEKFRHESLDLQFLSSSHGKEMIGNASAELSQTIFPLWPWRPWLCGYALQSKVPCLDVASQAPGHSAELGCSP